MTITPSQLDAATDALTRRFITQGFRHPDVAATVTVGRGLLGVDQVSYADRVGVDIELLRLVESGQVPVDEVPSALIAATSRLGAHRP